MPISPPDISRYHGQALITLVYDDGFKNDFENALPLHLEFNMQAGFAIIAGRMLTPKHWDRYMEPWQVTEAAKQGVEICSHSYSHPRLTEVDDATLDTELKKSQDILNETVGDNGNKVTTFCVPFSNSDDRVIAAAEKYYSTVRIKGRKFTPLHPKDDRVVYSFGLTKESTFDEVKDIIDKAVAEKAWVTIMLHGVVPKPIPDQREFDIDTGLLKQILGYIKDFGPDTLLPINLSDIHAVRAKAQSPKPASSARESAPAFRLG
ncbi:MAG: polysaccharide deacetylase family protein [Alphaproteobacteria bacterium]